MKTARTQKDNDRVSAALMKAGIIIIDDFDQETVERDNEQELTLNEQTGVVKVMTQRAI